MKLPACLLVLVWECKGLRKELVMLETIALLLLIMWGLGMISSYTMGGFIHILLVVALVVVLLRIISGRSL